MSFSSIKNFISHLGHTSFNVETVTFVGVIVIIVLILGAFLCAGIVYYAYPYRAELESAPVAVTPKILDEKRLASLESLLKMRKENFVASSTIPTPPAFR